MRKAAAVDYKQQDGSIDAKSFGALRLFSIAASLPFFLVEKIPMCTGQCRML